ncbi:MAG: molybdopterin dinucleotide binding domain-containing protein [Methanothrix sp.]|nr:molybdopterin dinucleotide binding domain-containing protein [Methanothrix sp.]MDD4447093.1 molybdopterin dinucleotide binding domain-containing protein [Methanothrix sp.]
MAEVDVTVVTVRDIFQDEAGRKSRFSEEYKNLSALIILDKQDMIRLGVKDGQKLLVQNDVGMVIVAAKTSEDEPHPGLAFMYNSPWSNQLVSDDVGEGSIPGNKRIKATLSIAEGNTTPISELQARMQS